MEKILSIIIPVYNVEKYIDRCINSLKNNESFNEIEILLIDDGSTDSSYDLCKNYENKYKNIKVYRKENGGASDARNFGAKKAKGKYIWFIDSDDEIKNCIKIFIEYLQNIEPDVMICQSKIIELDGNIFDECKYSIPKGIYTSEEFMIQLKRHRQSVMFCPQYYIVKRDFIEKNDLYFYKGIIYEDELWIPQLLIKAKKIFYSNENVYFHYMIESSVMHSTKLEKCGQSDYIVATELFKIYDSSNRNDLQFLRDKAANIFLQSTWKINSFLKNKKINRSLPLKNSYYLKTYVKSILYFISPKLYLLIHKITTERS